MSSEIDLSEVDVGALLAELQGRFSLLQQELALKSKAPMLTGIDGVGDRLRTERKRQGLTLMDLCDLAGVGYATLNKVEQGHPSARIDTVQKLAQALGMQIWIG